MKYLISNNFKMNHTTAFDLVNKVLPYKVIDGFEVCPNYNSENELKFMEDLAFECKKNNLLFQVHGDSSVPYSTQIEFINRLDKLSNMLGYKINLVLHPITKDTVEESLKASNEFYQKILEDTKDMNIIINTENLNSTKDMRRLNLNEVKQLLYNNSNLKLTYDIGHSIVEHESIFIEDEEIIKRISNIHIHSYDYVEEHHIILENDLHKNEVIKGLLFLKKIKYDGSIVFEYDFYRTNSLDYDECIKNYIESIKYVKEHF